MASGKIKIKLLQGICGHRSKIDPKTKKPVATGQFVHNPGTILEWDAEEAGRWIENGVAEKAA